MKTILPAPVKATLMGVMVTLLLTGCAVGPKYTQPDSTLSPNWPSLINDQGPINHGVDARSMNWRDFVLDPELREVVTAALSYNHDLREALLRIDEAKSLYQIESVDKVPHFNGTASGSRQRTSGNSTAGSSSTDSTYSANIGLSSYELDLFGRVSSLSESALQSYLATEQSSRSIQISLIAEVVEAYLNRNGAFERYQLTLQTQKSRETSLYLMDASNKAGSVSEIDYLEALGLLQQAQADLQAVSRELAESENILVLLTGLRHQQLPQAGPSGAVLLQADLSPGLPSSLLERRPDIIGAEHTLKAKNADIAAARAAFYPKISLTGQYGVTSSDLSNLFNSGSIGWQFMPQISLPIFDGGRNKANLELAEVRKEISIVQYEKAIQTAFREVADALAARQTLKKEEYAREALAKTSLKSLNLSKVRYQHGRDSHLRYLDAQRSNFTNQINRITTRTKRQISLVTLFKVLGGGWQPEQLVAIAKTE